MMHAPDGPPPASPVDAATSPVDVARNAIWRLFQEGYVDEDMATASLLAVDLGTRRGPKGARSRWPTISAHSDHAALSQPTQE